MSYIRQALETDLDAIMRLEREAFAQGWSRGAWAEELAHHWVQVAHTPDVTGVISMGEVAGTAELRRIIVSTPSRGKGVARALTNEGLDWVTSRGATEVFLEVSGNNAAAQCLYISVGFLPIDVRKDYYGPSDDAIVMMLTLNRRIDD
ncbi:MAG: GNAT family N-acetyltransferase [Propionibacteriaceae bacterium]|jgi:ribosomal-protein-alanine N-acetyltransferase|nr:GNAT family N-acetyltransferase [Propionibacteriaceae bacterium]